MSSEYNRESHRRLYRRVHQRRGTNQPDMTDDFFLDTDEEQWTAAEAAATPPTYATAIAERGPDQVTRRDFKTAHDRMLRDPVARRAASGPLSRCTTPDLLWGHRRSVATGSGSWQLRRNAAHALIDPVLEALHGESTSPADELVTRAATRRDAESVRDAWTRAREPRDYHPEGAITMARTLLESTLKTILDDRNVDYDNADDLPALYRAVSVELALAPAAYSEQAFKQILRGMPLSSGRPREPSQQVRPRPRLWAPGLPTSAQARRARGQPRWVDGAVPHRDARGPRLAELLQSPAVGGIAATVCSGDRCRRRKLET